MVLGSLGGAEPADHVSLVNRGTVIVGADSLRYGDVVGLIDAAYAAQLRIALVTPGMTAEATGKKGG